MSTLPPNLSGGSPAPTHADYHALRKFALENALTSGAPGIRRRAFGGGSLVTPVPQQRRRPSGFIARTLFVTDASEPSDAKVTVSFGQINGETPTIGGSPISNVPAPALSVVTGAVYLHAVIDTDGIITTLTIENAATMPGDTDVDGYLTLALVTVSGGVVSLIQPAAWNVMQMQVCGSVADESDVTTFLWGGFGE